MYSDLIILLIYHESQSVEYFNMYTVHEKSSILFYNNIGYS